MALRLVEIFLPETHGDVPHLETHNAVLGCWRVPLSDGHVLLRVLLDTGDTEALLNWLDDEIGLVDDYRIALLPVEATVPRPTPLEADVPPPEAGPPPRLARVSREELYQDVADAIDIGKIYYTFVVLSTVVAAGGLLRDNVAVVIGAMVIAPLLGPNIALALGSTLGDTGLLRRAMKVNIIGVTIALTLSLLIGLIFKLTDGGLPQTAELLSRTEVSLADVALALAAGVAGALSFTRGMADSLIGVMVAVALLPPLVAFGMLAGGGAWPLALGAAMLLLINVVCVNLAGVTTFLAQGIRPNRWYEAEAAQRATRRAILLWIAVLAVLVAAIIVSG